MTSLMNTVIVLAFLLVTGFPQTTLSGQSQEANLYCSEDYHFCAKFPSSILTFKATLVQENGIILKSEDGFAEVIIAGFPLPPNTDTKTLFLSSAREKSALEDGPKVISSIFGEDFYECYFMVGRYYYYHQSYLFADHFVKVEIKVPISMPDKLQILQKQIHLEFDIPPFQEKATSELGMGMMKE